MKNLRVFGTFIEKLSLPLFPLPWCGQTRLIISLKRYEKTTKSEHLDFSGEQLYYNKRLLGELLF